MSNKVLIFNQPEKDTVVFAVDGGGWDTCWANEDGYVAGMTPGNGEEDGLEMSMPSGPGFWVHDAVGDLDQELDIMRASADGWRRPTTEEMERLRLGQPFFQDSSTPPASIPVPENKSELATLRTIVGEVELALGGRTQLNPNWSPLARAVHGLRQFTYDAALRMVGGTPENIRAGTAIKAAHIAGAGPEGF